VGTVHVVANLLGESGMKVDQALVDACYRQLINKDFHGDETGITFRMPEEDKRLMQAAGEKQLKRACQLALERKGAEDAAEIYGLDPVRFKEFMKKTKGWGVNR
jgi:hypothetical protein